MAAATEAVPRFMSDTPETELTRPPPPSRGDRPLASTLPPPSHRERLLEHLGARSGTILGRYELVRRIGRGGMAEVYEAVHRGLKKTVALKVLLPEVAENEELRARFLREGEAASRIRHPHVVDVTDVGEDGGVPYLVMELLEGESLGDVLARSGRLSVSRTLDIVLPIAAALVEAHRQGVVHRDLKPDNVFIARAPGGRALPKLLDFGVSKLTTEGAPSATAVSAVLGTPHYMAPEQALGQSPIDARADQYSLALMIYECITGALPFASQNVVALLHEVSRGVNRPPSHYTAELPPGLDEVLLRALSREPSDRFASSAELVGSLVPFASERAVRAYHALLEDGEPSASSVVSVRPPRVEITAEFPLPDGPRRAGQVPPARPDAVGPKLRLLAPPRLPSPAEVRLLANFAGPHAERESTPDASAISPRAASGVAATELPPNRRTTPARRDHVVLLPAASPAAHEAASGEPRRSLVLGALVLAIASGLGWWLTRPLLPDAPPPLSAAQGLEARRVELVDPLPSSTPIAAVPAPPSPPPGPTRTHVFLLAFPRTATIELDGAEAGIGQLDRWVESDGTTHTVVVRAAGYRPRTLTFTDQAPPARVELARIDDRPPGAVRRQAPAEEEWLRTAR